MQFTIRELARTLGAVAEGDSDTVITGVAGIADAGPNDLTFLAQEKYAHLMDSTTAGAVLVPRSYNQPARTVLLRVEDPYLSLVQVLKILSADMHRTAPGVHPTAVLDPEASIGEDAAVGALAIVEAGAVVGNGAVIGPGTYIGRGAAVGAGSLLHPNVTICERVILGERVTVHSGTVLGADGFGFLHREGSHEKIPQVGTVVVEDDVEIGANVAVDRATIGVTRIEHGVKIDNLVHIAHNVVVGANTLVVAQVGISGSTEVGRGVTIAGQAGLVGHIKIGDGARIAGQAGVTKSVPPHATVSDYPALDHDRARRLQAYYRKLPNLFDQLKRLEERVRELESEREKIL